MGLSGGAVRRLQRVPRENQFHGGCDVSYPMAVLLRLAVVLLRLSTKVLYHFSAAAAHARARTFQSAPLTVLVQYLLYSYS